MKSLIKNISLLLLIAIVFSSCSESRRNVSEQLNQLNEKAEEFNSAVDNGLRKVESLDSAVRSGADRIEKYDSLIKNSASQLDSVANQKVEAFKELTTY